MEHLHGGFLMGTLIQRVVLAITLCVAFGRGSSLYGLRFQEKTTAKGSHILVARDCKNFSSDIKEFSDYDERHPCRDGEKSEGFRGPMENYVGDEAELDFLLNLSEHRGNLFSALAAVAGYGGDSGTVETIQSLLRSPKPFDEVWLLSGGGDVDAGVGFARTLRRHGMTVEVPADYQCISACTIAFMGGALRYIDGNAAFRVHSASMYEGGVSKQIAQEFQQDPDAALSRVARSQQIDERYLALRLMTLFQNTLTLPLRSAPRPENDADFCRWAGGSYSTISFSGGRSRGYCDTEGQTLVSPHLAYADSKNAVRAADVALIRREGPAAYQDILMRVERDCMSLALDDLELEVAERGPRAKPALKMLRAMFMTSITDTSYMTHLQLVTMGYVTESIELPK
jgi:hypothetical protein